jgi:hypothetical protein
MLSGLSLSNRLFYFFLCRTINLRVLHQFYIQLGFPHQHQERNNYIRRDGDFSLNYLAISVSAFKSFHSLIEIYNFIIIIILRWCEDKYLATAASKQPTVLDPER